MTDSSTDPNPPLYASFLRRFQAIQVDSIILMVVLAVAVLAAMQLKSDAMGRVIGITVVAFILVYEPVFVALWGGTLGHRQRNLHVVDDRTGGRLSFPKALARTLVKLVLGWVSFLSMLFTRPSQALHDLATRTTVRIRDPRLVRPSDFVPERGPGSALRGRSMLRVFAMTGLWLLGVIGLFATALVLLVEGGVLTLACINFDRCQPIEDLWANGLAWTTTLLLIGVVVLAWRGSLPGCRIPDA